MMRDESRYRNGVISRNGWDLFVQWAMTTLQTVDIGCPLHFQHYVNTI